MRVACLGEYEDMWCATIHFNTIAINRPLDDLSSERVRVEAEAMVALLAAVEDGIVEWIGSEYLDFEVGQDPDGEPRRRPPRRVRRGWRRGASRHHR